MSKKTRKKTPRKALRNSPAAAARKASVKTSRAKTGGKAAGKSKAARPAKSASPTKSKSSPTKPRNQPAGNALGGKAHAPSAGKSGLAEGARAPAFHLPRDGGDTVSLSDYAGEKLVLFFYPRADTPGCTREAIDFTRLGDAFAESRTAILGISADPPKTQEAFRDKHRLSIPLLSDETHGMLEAYGAWGEKSMYGRTFQGIIRTTVLVGADGRVARIWRHVRVDGHADEVLAAARAL
ncbi:MAG: peroxiredoxin [Bradyrhizobium sp.]|uniref:peroxiredoxin n=1 Tax=Bradyrhizobium sp. TaxID=376 RepID=UPI001210660B|nr:peroxiredoxin [Bradyrhizobium sp.]THD62485.1 MAG: peroxiredoxin [Bradyrhizobium sp.]